MKKKIAEGKALGLKYEIFDNSGIIDHIEFSEDMIYIAQQHGRHIRVPELDHYPFHMNRQQHLQLQGEHDNIELHDMEAIGNDGQELTLFMLTHGKNNQGSYFSSLTITPIRRLLTQGPCVPSSTLGSLYGVCSASPCWHFSTI